MILTRYKGNFKLEMHFTGWWHVCVHIYQKKKLLWIFPYYSRVWTTYRQEPGTLLSLENFPKWGLTDEEKGINWNDYPKFFKEGSFFKRQNYMKGDVMRTKVVETDCFDKFKDLSTEERVDFIFSKKIDTRA